MSKFWWTMVLGAVVMVGSNILLGLLMIVGLEMLMGAPPILVLMLMMALSAIINTVLIEWFWQKASKQESK